MGFVCGEGCKFEEVDVVMLVLCNWYCGFVCCVGEVYWGVVKWKCVISGIVVWNWCIVVVVIGVFLFGFVGVIGGVLGYVWLIYFGVDGYVVVLVGFWRCFYYCSMVLE